MELIRSAQTWAVRFGRPAVSVVRDGQTNLDVVTVNADWVHRDWFGRWWACRDSCSQVELGAVHPALDVAALYVTFGQRYLTVGAFVTDRVDFAQAARNAEAMATDIKVYRRLVVENQRRAGFNPAQVLILVGCRSGRLVLKSHSELPSERYGQW